jgi:triphosphoribosyl-dephospho-CoA synthetase
MSFVERTVEVVRSWHVGKPGMVGLLALGTVSLAGCDSASLQSAVTQAANQAGTLFTQTGNFMSAGDDEQPSDDGTSCYSPQRVTFYAAVAEVNEAQRMQSGAAAGALVAGFAATYADSTVSKLAATGFAAAMGLVIADIETDRTRIAAVTDSFDSLVACRSNEAQQINDDYKNRRLEREAAEEKLATLRRLLAQDIQVAQGTNAILKERNNAFELSTQQIEAEAPPPATTNEAAQRKEQVQKADAAIQTNQKVLSQQTASIEEAEALANSPEEFELSLWMPARTVLAALSGY